MQNYANYDELYHYGVKGMRWGIRKKSYYDSRVEANLRKAENAKTSYGKARALNRAEINKYYADRARRRSNVKTVKDAFLVDHGNADAVKAMKAYTNIEKNNARASKTKLMRQVHKVNAMNNEEATKVREAMRDAKGIKNKGKAYINGMLNMKTANISGRRATIGERMAESMIPGLGLMRDVEYYRKHKKDFGKVD